jgi:hypothetical protein
MHGSKRACRCRRRRNRNQQKHDLALCIIGVATWICANLPFSAYSQTGDAPPSFGAHSGIGIIAPERPTVASPEGRGGVCRHFTPEERSKFPLLCKTDKGANSSQETPSRIMQTK